MRFVETVWLVSLTPDERAALDPGAADILRTPDVLVVGAGLVGLATAYFLAERQMRVQVIDAGPVARGATGASAGGVWPNDQGPSHPPAFQPLAFLSRDLWGRL